MLLNQLSSLFVFLLVTLSTALKSIVPPKTALIYDSKITNIEEYTKLLTYLKDELNLKLSTYEYNSEDLSIFKNGELNYQNLIIFPTKARNLGAKGSIKGLDLVEFFNKGGDVFAITSPQGVSESVRNFYNQLGIYPSPKNHELVDHFNGLEETDKLIKLSAENNLVLQNNIIESVEGIEFQGSSSLISNNPQIFPIVQASTTSYTKNSQGDDDSRPWTVGKEGYLTVGFQGLNNARSLWLGDISQLNDSKLGSFGENLLKWTFQFKNILKSIDVSHNHISGESYEDRQYKVKDEIEYKITLQEYDGQVWKPTSIDDLQFEIKLIDPYYRLNLSEISSSAFSTTYGVKFAIPDRHGVYTLQTIYKRPGYSFIEEAEVLSIRHLANDEYPRSWEITNSWVYLTSSIVVFTAWFAFVIIFIYIKDDKSNAKKNK
ncbi:hypothetical protein WICMUC_000179 [Wickerhamomyces mucosus]|uniref:Dolichyl-diphosphooligosaccharide--protein glycosyltransferase subunit WBP1 n=1 Tax=Wickerhamomyces mucosus TaxID=1378264 RepID=A0A9P8Q077_9ASCO|nr:hypothetical protein WICMUC_000179 [Wickerhamomyces mucosus]